MRQIFLLAAITIAICTHVKAQRVGVGTTQPIARLSVDSGLNIDQANVNGIALESALTFGNNKRVGIGSRRTSGANMSGLDFYTGGIRHMSIDSVGRVGIGTASPVRDLHVSGNTYTSLYLIAGAGLSAGLGDVIPQYDLHTGIGYFENRVGIGTVPHSSYYLDIGPGSVRMQGAVRIEGILNPNNALTIGNNTTVEGTLTVEGTSSLAGTVTAAGIIRSEGRGLVRGTGSSMQRMERMTIQLSSGNLAAGAAVNSADYFYNNGSFSGTPFVMVGQLLSSTGGDGSRLQFIPYDVTTSSFKIRVFNQGATTANITATYEVLIVGPD